MSSTATNGTVVDQTHAQFVVNLSFLVIYAVLGLLSVPLFIYRRNLEPIRSREWSIAVLQILVPLADLIIRTLGPIYIPCSIDVIRQLAVLPLWLYPYQYRCFLLWYRSSRQSSLLHVQKAALFRDRVIKFIHRNNWLTNIWFQILLFFVVIFGICIAISLVISFSKLPFTPICQKPSITPVIIAEGLICIALALMNIYLLWNVRDAFLIKQEMTFLILAGVPFFVVWALATLLKWEGVVFSMFWTGIVEIIFLVGSILIPLWGSYRRARILQAVNDCDSVTQKSHEAQFRLIPEQEEMKKGFEKFCIETWSVENLIFQRKIEEFKSLPDDKLVDEATSIYHEFIANESRSQINIDMSLQERIMERIQSKDISRDMFDEAKKMTDSLLRDCIFPLWMSTPGFRASLKRAGLAFDGVAFTAL